MGQRGEERNRFYQAEFLGKTVFCTKILLIRTKSVRVRSYDIRGKGHGVESVGFTNSIRYFIFQHFFLLHIISFQK